MIYEIMFTSHSTTSPVIMNVAISLRCVCQCSLMLVDERAKAAVMATLKQPLVSSDHEKTWMGIDFE